MKGEKAMMNNAYLATELAGIGIRFESESREHRVIESIIEILLEGNEKEDPLN